MDHCASIYFPHVHIPQHTPVVAKERYVIIVEPIP